MGSGAAPPAVEDVPLLHFRRAIIGTIVILHLGMAIAVALIPFSASGSDWGHRILIGIVVGTAFAQVSLTAAWCALGPGSFFLRVPLSLLAASLAGLSLAAFMLKTSGGNDFWFSVALTLVGWFMLQPPLWLVSVWLKYRVSLPGEPTNQQTNGTQFTLAHMLLWTLGVALLLGVGRMALRNASVSYISGWRIETSFFLIFLGINFLLAVPVILAVTGLKSPLCRVIAAAAWSIVLGGVQWLCLASILGLNDEPKTFALVMLLNGVHGFVLGGSLFALTMLGYRLRRENTRPGPFVGSLNPAKTATAGQFPANASKD